MRLSDALSDWRRETAHHRPNTRYALERASVRWLRAFGDDATLESLAAEVVRDYVVRYRGDHAASTTNQEVNYLRWFLGHCRRRGFLERNPAEGAPRYPTESREPRSLTPPELLRLLNLAEVEVKAVILLAVETGLRRSTILALRWEWLDLKTGWLRIPARHMKGRRAYSAPLSEAALDALRSIKDRDSGRIFRFERSCLAKHFNAARVRAGLPDVVFHDLRRTFFSRMRAKGVPLEVAMRLSDHHDTQTALRHYRSISPEELLRAVGRVADEIKDASSG